MPCNGSAWYQQGCRRNRRCKRRNRQVVAPGRTREAFVLSRAYRCPTWWLLATSNFAECKYRSSRSQIDRFTRLSILRNETPGTTFVIPGVRLKVGLSSSNCLVYEPFSV